CAGRRRPALTNADVFRAGCKSPPAVGGSARRDASTSPRAPACRRACGVSRPGRIPGPTVIVRMKEDHRARPFAGRGPPFGRLPPCGKRTMFTGLIQGIGALASREARGAAARLRVAFGTLAPDDIQLGESIA